MVADSAIAGYVLESISFVEFGKANTLLLFLRSPSRIVNR